MRIVVLGGAGKMGSLAVQDLAGDRRVSEVILADRDMVQAQRVAAVIDSPKVRLQTVDLNNRQRLLSLLKDAQTCLNATVYYTNLPVMEACIEAGCHYTDMGGLFHTTRRQLQLHDRFAEAGASAVLGMGSAPGIPNVQARYAADRLDTVETIRIYDGILPPPPDDVRFTYAVPTILDEMTQSPMVYRNGEFLSCDPLSEFEDYWFTPPLGLLPMHLSLHSEVATLPLTFGHMGLKECFFKINYWGMAKETVDKVRVLADFGFTSSEPVTVQGSAVVPRDLLITMMAGYVPPIEEFLASSSRRPPDWAKEIVTEVRGSKDGRPLTYRVGTLTCKGALPTGVAPARAAIWLAEGRIPPGVHPPEAVLDPAPFFQELAQRDIHTQVSVTHTL